MFVFIPHGTPTFICVWLNQDLSKNATFSVSNNEKTVRPDITDLSVNIAMHYQICFA